MKPALPRVFALGILAVVVAAQAASAATSTSAKLADNAKKDPYYAYAVKHFGKPTDCRVSGIQTFDGQTFGTVTYRFRNGIALKDETAPPEVFRVSLSRDRGLPDPAGIRRFAEQDAQARGFHIDFRKPSRDKSPDGLTTLAYWDPDTGLNAAVELSYRSDKLVGVSVHAAL